jgi:predicted ribosome quality control (RQC) complex YloA/Tae2 family protein
MLLTLLQSRGPQPQIYQQIWIIEERKKGEPRKARRVIKKIKKQLQQTVSAIDAAQQAQSERQSLEKQQEALRLAEEQIAISFQLLELQIKANELNKAAEAYQAKIRLEEYIRQEYEKAVRLYQEEKKRKEAEEYEELQLLLTYLMQEL